MTEYSDLTFSVDTHLFTELGELLVGRDSTALVELVKNAYDADAESVTIFAENLAQPEDGVITVVDDGVGMRPDQFVDGFLRVAGQGKQEGQRKSKRYGRRFTGAKGIGRLAAHKLATRLEVESIAGSGTTSNARSELHASIDWREVERHRTLDEVRGSDAIRLGSESLAGSAPTGTTIRLRRLRNAWTQGEKNLFLAEMQTFQPPSVLTMPIPRTVVAQPLLFGDVIVRDSGRRDKGMKVDFEGEFALAEDYWLLLAEHANWVLEIDARRGKKNVDYAFAPTVTGQETLPASRPGRFSIPHPSPNEGPFFQARILLREGAWPRAVKEANLLRRSYGIRVYLEGFRVLPYGEPGNDWLDLDKQYTSRGRRLPELSTFKGLEPVKDEGLSAVPNNNYYGAVFLTTEGAPTMRTLVNREGFVPDRAVSDLQLILRTGTDLLTRARAAATLESRQRRRRERLGPGDAGLGLALGESLERATAHAEDAHELVAQGDVEGASVAVSAAVTEIKSIGRLARELISEAGLVRILASLGTQMAAFIHETNGLLSAVVAVDTSLQKIEADESLSIAVRHQLGILTRATGDLRERLERQAAYLTDVISADARRRRMRLSLANRFDVAVRLFMAAIERRGVRVDNEVPEDLTPPPMFPAEVMTILTNLISNAVKAVDDGGSIRATGSVARDGAVRFKLENSGERVDLGDAERWFNPYTSTSTTIDSAMGQGMGLGLPITRSLLAEYGAWISFVKPSRGFNTAVEITWPSGE